MSRRSFSTGLPNKYPKISNDSNKGEILSELLRDFLRVREVEKLISRNKKITE